MKMMRTQAGFSLIEVLIAVVILAIGILGVAGLQVVSMQQNRNALLRAQALQVGNDMLDRMRANPTADYGGVDYDTDPPAGIDTCINNVCTENEMRDFDLAQWKCSINSTNPDGGAPYDICTTLGVSGNLPNGAGSITEVGDIHEVRVRWQTNSAGALAEITLRTRTQ